MQEKIKKILLKKDKSKIVCLTAYSKQIAKILDKYCDIILVGDSMANVLYGYKNTHKISLENIIQHANSVRTGVKKSLLVSDMPKGTYEKSPSLGLKNARKILKLTNCDALKLEGGTKIIKLIKILVKNKIPVMSHIGLQPQNISDKKKFKVLGKTSKEEKKIINDLISVEKAGSFAVVLESVSESFAKKINKISNIPVIGIGASKNCNGQILVTEDLLGLFNRSPKFVKRYESLRIKIKRAVQKYYKDVVKGQFPGKNNIYR